jgi:uncharacterized membrane protein
MRASLLRQRAKMSLTGNYWNAVLVAFVAAIMGGLLPAYGPYIEIDAESFSKIWRGFSSYAVVLLSAVGSIGSVLSIVNLVLGGVVQIGYAKYLLKQYNGHSGEVKDLFSCFDYFAQGFLQKLLRILYIILWSFLFIVPGIIKALSYSMTPFIMAENPEMKAKNAIQASETLMHGHKADLFYFLLSYIGWYFFAVLTCGIGVFFLNPYIHAGYTAFYRSIVPPKNQ